MPSDLNLGRTYPAEAVIAVLKHLALYWGEKPLARASERRATTGRITVVPGFVPLLDELERDESDALNFTESAAESWIVENVSDNGFGAIVPPAASDWIRVGELIGVQVEGSARWGVAIIRRVAQDEERHYRVGIEVIAHTVAAVWLSRGSGEPEHAILLSMRPDSNGEVGRHPIGGPLRLASRRAARHTGQHLYARAQSSHRRGRRLRLGQLQSHPHFLGAAARGVHVLLETSYILMEVLTDAGMLRSREPAVPNPRSPIRGWS